MSTGYLKTWLPLLLAVTLVAGCGDSNGNGNSNVAPNSAKAVTAYSLAIPAGGTATGTVDETAKTIAVTMPFGTNVTALVATFESTGGSVTVGGLPQVSGTTANNFATPVAYSVAATDGTTAAYTVTVAVAPITGSAVTTFTVAGVAGTVDESASTISVILPNGTDLNNLVASFTTTGASVKVGAAIQTSGTTANNFPVPVIYTVTAADGTSRIYTVTVTVAASAAKDITAYSLAGVAGTLDPSEKRIAVTLPNGTNPAALVATFTTTGASVKVSTTVQKSGTTANNFTAPVAYLVTAADGTTATYTVTVTLAANSAKEITAYSLAGVAGTINEGAKAISVTVPSGTNVTALAATFTTTGASVKIGTVTQINGTANNFTTPVSYTVTAANNTTQIYTVTVTVPVALGPAVVNLGAAGNYVILATSKVTTVTDSVITGDVGLSPAATSYYGGFSPTMVGTTSAISAQVTGSLFGADMTAPTSTNLTTAVDSMLTAYTDAAGRPTPDFTNEGAGEIGGKTLIPGLYKWTTAVTASSDVTISGGANDVWIFQIPENLSLSPAINISLSGGAKAKNIFWQVAGEVIIGTTAHFEGIILSKTQITLETGASMIGRALAQTAVILQVATVTKPD